MSRQYISFDQSLARLSYEGATGVVSRGGKPAGSRSDQGYIQVKVGGRGGRIVKAHRLAWFLFYGVWPKNEIDHVNGNRTDNRISNLREVTPSLNRMNQRVRSDNSSGVTGVYFDARKGRWVSHICAFGKRKHLGTFASQDRAIAVRLTAQREMGFGPNHGSSQ